MMPRPLPRKMPLSIDVAIYLKQDGSTEACAVIDRDLVSLLLAIDRTGSVKHACEATNCSVRSTQRTLRRFAKGSGIDLLQYHGWQGTGLTDEARQCIALYFGARMCLQQLARNQSFPRVSARSPTPTDDGTSPDGMPAETAAGQASESIGT